MTTDKLYDLLVRRVEEAITALTQERREQIKSSDIKGWVQTKYPDDAARLLPSWSTYLPYAALDPETRIARRPGTYAYILKEPAAQGQTLEEQQEAATEGNEPQPQGRTRNEREQRLYPVLREWLAGKKYRAAVTANSRAGGAWGNPDVTGVRTVEGYLGARTIEIATVEAKVTAWNWKREFFEAVSHKRFAHRAYFAIGEGSDNPSLDKLPYASEMREYGEKFGVGIVVVFMPTATYDLLTSSSTLPVLATEDVVFAELWPAVFDWAPSHASVDFLRKTLGLQSDEALYAFGNDPDSSTSD